MTDAPSLSGRVCLVTGAGRGIGAELAAWFAEAGARLVLCSRSGDELRHVAGTIATKFGVEVMAETCDVADAAAVARLVAGADERFGAVDVAVANAAVLGPVGDVASLDLAAWSAAVDVNVGGTTNLVAAVVPGMTARGFGRIVTLAGGGVGGPRPAVRASAYLASKAAVVAFTEVVAAELPDGVTINAVAPGRVPTTFLHDVLAAGAAVAGADLYATATDDRPGDLGSLRDLMEYLVSDRAGWLSGRLLSARWERPESLEQERAAIQAGSRYRMRRIDEDLYREVGGP